MLTLISQKAVSMKLMKQSLREGSLGGMDTGICMVESLCCPPETMNIANQLYSGIKSFLKKDLSTHRHREQSLVAKGEVGKGKKGLGVWE